ncbi:MAG: ParA family protein [Hymenobacter sp.]|nr:MAG: ParA family protein [Hymenobacter sp.]
MSKILAITNQKGGVGKTTSTANIGAGLARMGKRVILVDLDPQTNLTKGLGIVAAEKNVYGALLGEYELEVYPLQKNLALVAGSPALSGFDKAKGDEVDREFLLKELLEPLREQSDYILLDCPPGLGLVTLNAYACAQALYIPLEAQMYGVDGLEKVLNLVKRMQRRLNPELTIGGLFFTRYNKHKILHRETTETLRGQYPDLLLKGVIRESVALGEAPHFGKDIFTYASHSAGATDYAELVTELLTR